MPRRSRYPREPPLGRHASRRTAAQNRARENFMGFMFFLTFLSAGTYFMVLRMMTPYDDRLSEQTKEESQTLPRCSDSNWSAGSAFFTVSALCFGYYAYPRGSLILIRSGRSWRLSPVLAAEETILIVSLFVHAKVVQKHKTTTICQVLLACRYLNECDPTEIRERLDLNMDQPPLDENTEVGRLMRESREASTPANALYAAPRSSAEQVVVSSSVDTGVEMPRDTYQTLSNPDPDLDLRPVATHVPVETTTARSNLNSPSDNEGTATYWHRLQLTKSIVKQRHVQYNTHLMQSFAHYTRDLDTGPSYRIFVWTPMILQAVKLLYILLFSSRVSRVTYLLSGIYFFSWLVIELVMIAATSEKLTPVDTEDAAQLMYEWREALDLLSGADKMRKRSLSVSFEIPSLWAAVALNVILMGKFTYDLGLPFIRHAWAAVLTVVGIYAAVIVVLGICISPVILLALHRLSTMLAKMPWAKKWISKTHDGDKILAVEPLLPASVALQSMGIIVSVYGEVGPWKGTFPCWSMTKPPDWFG